MNDHLLRCQSALRAHVRPQSPGNASYLQESPSTLRAQGNADDDFPTGAPCIWPLLRHLRFLNRLHHPTTRTGS
jgi:hypothetical protein